jgi:hypothetical protein
MAMNTRGRDRKTLNRRTFFKECSLKRFSSSIALSLALVLLLGVGSVLMACGNACPAGKCAGAASCPATASTSTVDTQAGNTASSQAACCPGQQGQCPKANCPDKGKCGGDKCKASLDVGSKTSLSTATTKTGARNLKAAKAVEAKPQAATLVKSNG